MDDIVRARVNEILHEKAAMGAGAMRKRKRGGVPVGGRRRGGVPVAGGERSYVLSKKKVLADIQREYPAPRSMHRSMLSATKARKIYIKRHGPMPRKERVGKVTARIRASPKALEFAEELYNGAYPSDHTLETIIEHLACARNDFRSRGCKNYRLGHEEREMLRPYKRKLIQHGLGEGARRRRRAGEGESVKQSHARSLFSKRIKRVNKLMKDGYSKSAAWDVVMGEGAYRKVRPKRGRGEGGVVTY